MTHLVQDLIPKGNSNRPQTALSPTYITVHETANTNAGANAEMHSKYLKSEDAQNRQVSWHITVDDKQAIQHLPFNEIGWHAGREGNYSSIGIEICVNQDGDFSIARYQAISIIRQLISSLDIPFDRVVTHQHWTGKNCPKNLLSEWAQFISELGDEDNMEGMKLQVLAESLWVYNKPNWKARYEVVEEGEVFTINEKIEVNGSTMYKLKSGLFITGNQSYVRIM